MSLGDHIAALSLRVITVTCVSCRVLSTGRVSQVTTQKRSSGGGCMGKTLRKHLKVTALVEASFWRQLGDPQGSG